MSWITENGAFETVVSVFTKQILSRNVKGAHLYLLSDVRLSILPYIHVICLFTATYLGALWIILCVFMWTEIYFKMTSDKFPF